MSTLQQRELVLVGGGHAHVQVLRRLMMRPEPGVRVTVVLDRPEAVYSGMVPGFAAGEYAAEELEIDVVPLARRARAGVILAPATGIDPQRKRVQLAGRPAIAYDVASLDVGSTVRGLDLPGVAEHAALTRPIRGLVDRLLQQLDEAARTAGTQPLRIAVVGGGAAGIELAMSVGARLRRAGRAAAITLLTAGRDVLEGSAPRVVASLRRQASVRGVAIRCGVRAVGAEKGVLQLEGGERFQCDLVLWATGAAAHGFVTRSPLPLDDQGFVRVRETLQVVGHDDLFAVGDCAHLDAHPWVPKAGVYAVRSGPTLSHNLIARLHRRPLRRYRPQRDFLSLLTLGEGRAFGSKWGVSAHGRAVWWLKDRIDRRFMRRFQVLAGDGGDAAAFPTPESMGMEEMACGGCAAKLAASPLERALGRLDAAPEDASVLLGLGRPDDAAALRLPAGDVLLASVDAFRAFCDDPYLVGQVAALNAVSDVLAKGGRARHAMALVTLPEHESDAAAEERLYQVLAGVRAALDPHAIALVGGHTTRGPELSVGLAVLGTVESEGGLLPLAGARVGDALLLSKPLGTGVLLAADMQGRARGEWLVAAYRCLLRSNVEAAAVASAQRVHAATDVSGFGLAGHLSELLRASEVSAELWLPALPVLPGVAGLLARGVRSSFHEQNRVGRRGIALDPEAARHPHAELIFDPQTSGGLLLALPQARAEGALRALQRAGDVEARVVGRILEPRPDGAAFAATTGELARDS